MTERSSRKRRPAWGKIVLAVVLIAALGAAWRYTPLSELVTAQRVKSWAHAVRNTPWAPALLILAYTPAAFVMFPRPLLTLFAIVAFGPWLGFSYSMVGVMIAAWATYYLGRVLPEKTVHRIAGDQLDRVRQRLGDHGFLAVFALRMAPLTPFPVDGVICGALHIKLWDYSAATFLGMAPGLLAMSVFGGQITRVLEGGADMNYWVIGGVIVFFIATTYAVGRWLAKRAS